MIEDHNYIMCMCRPKGRTARGEPGAATAVARLQDEGYVSGFLSTLGVILYYYLIMLLSIVVVLNIF